MNSILEKYKPAASARTHLVAAAVMWSLVGTALAGFGFYWVTESQLAYRWIFVAVAVMLGLAKSFWVLDKAAGKMILRIRKRGDGRCIGGFLSPWSWLMVICMSVAGRMLRAYVLTEGWAGVLYVLVGVALLVSSRKLWKNAVM